MTHTRFSSLIICLMLLISTSALADSKEASIIGTWVTDGAQFMDEDDQARFQKAEFVFAFTKSAVSCTMIFEGTFTESNVPMTLGVEVSGNGYYKKRGKLLDISFEDATVACKVNKFGLNVDNETKAKLNEAGLDENMLKSLFEAELKKNDWAESFESIKGKLVISQLTSTTLVLTDEKGKTLTFTRRKTNKR